MRDERIDVLRFIGLALIVLAHVQPPPVLFQIRNFDVPLMVLISGASFALSYKGEPYASYVWKRTKRLLFPTWIFLTVYFLAILAGSKAGFGVVLPDHKTIATSYMLLSGIGYVWIIRVLLMVAIVAPLLHRTLFRVASATQFFLILTTTYILYEVVLLVTESYLDSITGKVFESSVLFLVPYTVLFALGSRLPNLSHRCIIGLAGISLATFSAFAIIHWHQAGHLVSTQEFKYPPSAYYLSYALLASCVAWLMSGALLVNIRDARLLKPVLFAAQNSIWIYLWHIPLINLIVLPYYAKYPVVFLGASLAAFLQVRLVHNFLVPNIQSPTVKKNISLVFTG